MSDAEEPDATLIPETRAPVVPAADVPAEAHRLVAQALEGSSPTGGRPTPGSGISGLETNAGAGCAVERRPIGPLPRAEA